LQARDADGETGRRHVVAAEAADEAVVAPAAADRAEAHRPAFVVLDLEGELHLEDGTGVVLQAAHDGGIDTNAIFSIASASCEFCNGRQIVEALLEQRYVLKYTTHPADQIGICLADWCTAMVSN